MTMTPEQLRELLEDLEITGTDAAANRWLEICEVVRAHAAALEELARVKRAIAESCDEQRGEYFGCRRAERAESALAESERKCERLKFHAGGMAYCCEALEIALTKAASIYANRVTLNIDDFLPLTKAYAAYRAEFKEES